MGKNNNGFNRVSLNSRRRWLLGVTASFMLSFIFILAGPAAPAVTQSDSPRAISEGARELTSSLVSLNTRYKLASGVLRTQLASELGEVAAKRQEALAAMIESDPGEVLRVAVPEGVRASLPRAIRRHIEQHVDMEGVLELVYSCGEGMSRLDYSVEVEGKKFTLHFTGSPADNLMTGAKVRVKGVQVGDAIALDPEAEGLSRAEGSGFQTMAPAYPNTFGEQKVLVILVNFQDKQTQPFTVDQVRNLVFGTVKNYYLETSYQQTWLAGDVYGWFTIPVSSSNCDTSAIAIYARQAAAAAGANLSAYNRNVFIFPSISCGFSGLGTVGGNPSQAWINGSLTLRTVAHELGHNLGLHHSRALECGSEVVGSNCSTIDYGHILDILGKSGVTGHFHGFQKERLGWLDYGSSPGITTAQTSGTYYLDPYETLGSGPKALRVLKSVDPSTGRKTWYYVEFRRPIGFDSFISSNSNVMNGVTVQMAIEGTGTQYLLDMTPETTSWSDPALVVGRSYNDATAGVTITPVSVDNTRAAINITLGSQSCVRVNPSMTISPSQTQWIQAGNTASYTVAVVNNNSASCNASNFDLRANVPDGWTARFASTTLNIAPGASATTTLQVTSPLGATDGFYTLGVTAANSSDSSYSATSSLTCAIVSSLNVTASSDQTSYTRTQTVSLAATVKAGNLPVSGANVTFTITKPNGSVVTGTAMTGDNGSVLFKYRLNKKQDPIGTYYVNMLASLGGITGSSSLSFTVR